MCKVIYKNSINGEVCFFPWSSLLPSHDRTGWQRTRWDKDNKWSKYERCGVVTVRVRVTIYKCDLSHLISRGYQGICLQHILLFCPVRSSLYYRDYQESNIATVYKSKRWENYLNLGDTFQYYPPLCYAYWKASCCNKLRINIHKLLENLP